MATQVKIKRGTTDATAPSGLTAGEMAINLVDKKLYVGGTGGTNVIFLDSTAVAGLSVANTFTQLNTFSAGISASGATFTSDIVVNSMTVGFGGGDSDSNVVLGGQNALLDNTTGTYNIAIGGGALASNTEGGDNIAIGGAALGANIDGNSNLAIGQQTLFSKATGSNNIAIGGYALWHATESEDNIAIGISVMQGSVGFGYNPGSYNIGIGKDALKAQAFTGNSNVAIGYAAGTNATTASQMTALGYQAGRYYGTGILNLTTGTGGIYIGYQARAGGLARTNEIVIGVDARGLGSNTAVIGATLQSAATIYGVLNLPSGLSASGATFTGNISAPNIVNSFNGVTGAVTGVSSFNGATGAVTGASLGANTFTALQTFSAGISASGATFTGSISGATATFSKDITVNYITVGLGGGEISNNVAVGLDAFASNTTGNRNVAVGESALNSNTEGSFNVGVGRAALSANTTGSDNVAVGLYALSANTTGESNVGVGTSALSTNTTGESNVAVGESALGENTTGSNKTAIGYLAGAYRGTGVSSLRTGTGGIYIGYQARGSTLAQTNEIVIGVNALGLGSNTAVIGATLQSAATIYGVLNLPSGLSAAGATFSAPITSTRMARHTSAAISAEKTANFTPTAAEDGTIFYINYVGKGNITITLDGLPIGWRAKFFNIDYGQVLFESTGDIYGEGGVNGVPNWLMEVICIDTDTYFAG